MNLLTAATNPVVRKLLPLFGEVSDALGLDDGSAAQVDPVVTFVRKILPFVKKARTTTVGSMTEDDVTDLFRTMNVDMKAQDAKLWLQEIQMFADNGDQTLKNFVTNNSLGMLKSVLTRGKEQPRALVYPELESVPSYDPETGIFNFS